MKKSCPQIFVKQKSLQMSDFIVPKRGLEPPPLARHDFESCAYTNSATWANKDDLYIIQNLGQKSIVP